MRNLLQYSSAACLLVLMLIKMMGMQIVVADYSLHKDFIAASLCENAAKPAMKCAGKCYLKKQLTRTNESPASQEGKGGSKSFSVDFFEPADITCFGNSISPISHIASLDNHRLINPFLNGIFRPPLQVAV